MAKPPISLMDRNVPAQLDPQDLEAEIELELPGSLEPREIGEIEVEMEEDGGAVIDFDPTATAAESAPQDFFGNLAENIDDQQLSTLAGELVAEYEANKSGRQEWEDAFANGLELLGFNYSERSFSRSCCTVSGTGI